MKHTGLEALLLKTTGKDRTPAVMQGTCLDVPVLVVWQQWLLIFIFETVVATACCTVYGKQPTCTFSFVDHFCLFLCH